MGGATKEGVDLGEVSDAIVGNSEVSPKLGHSGSEGEDLVFHCHQLTFTRGTGHVTGIFLKLFFR